MLAKSSGIYTTAQVESQLRAELGTQEFRWRIELRDKERNVINSDLGLLEDGSIDWVFDRRIRLSGQLKFIKRSAELTDFSTLLLASSPIFHWRVGESSGTNANDNSPNNRDGTYQNTPTLNVGSLLKGDQANGAVSLNGTNEYISIADNAAFDVAYPCKFIVFKTTSTATERIYERDDTDPNHCWVIFHTAGVLSYRVYVGGVATTVSTGMVINDGLSHMCVCLKDSTHMRVYIDGVQIFKQALAGNVDSVNSGINVSSFRGASNFFTGVVDEVALFGAPLPAKVIRDLYRSGANQQEEIDFDTDRVGLYLQMRMADGGFAEWARGEFLLGYQNQRETETGTRYECLALDKVKILDDYKFQDRYVIASGTLYTTAISALLALVYLPGEYSVSTTSTLTLTASLSFQVGENLLDAVNKLATAIHYGNAFSDANGSVILEEYVKPVSRAIDDTWDVDNGQSFLTWERETSSNRSEIFNVVVAKSVSPKNGTITRAIARNTNASHPANVGKVGPRVFPYEVQAGDSGTLQSIADRKLIELSTLAEKFKTGSVFIPFYENDEKVRKIEDAESIDYHFLERHTSLSGKPPFIENYTMAKIYNI